MKGISRHMIAVLLLAGLAYFLSGCSNEVLIGEKGGKDDSDDGKVMLAMTVRATPLSVSGDTGRGKGDPFALCLCLQHRCQPVLRSGKVQCVRYGRGRRKIYL